MMTDIVAPSMKACQGLLRVSHPSSLSTATLPPPHRLHSQRCEAARPLTGTGRLSERPSLSKTLLDPHHVYRA